MSYGYDHPRSPSGTMGHEDPRGDVLHEQGSLFRVDGTKVTTLTDKISISNGLAWDLKEKAFYYSDSLEHCIRRYDYDVETGNICEYNSVLFLS